MSKKKDRLSKKQRLKVLGLALHWASDCGDLSPLSVMNRTVVLECYLGYGGPKAKKVMLKAQAKAPVLRLVRSDGAKLKPE